MVDERDGLLDAALTEHDGGLQPVDGGQQQFGLDERVQIGGHVPLALSPADELGGLGVAPSGICSCTCADVPVLRISSALTRSSWRVPKQYWTSRIGTAASAATFRSVTSSSPFVLARRQTAAAMCRRRCSWSTRLGTGPPLIRAIRLVVDHSNTGVVGWVPGGFPAQLGAFVVAAVLGLVVAGRANTRWKSMS